MGAVKNVPVWTVEQEKLLLDLIKENKPIEEIAEALNRSVDAVAMKAKRMGLPVPPRKKSLARTGENKVTRSEATTTSMEKLPPIKPAKELLSLEEIMKIMLGALNRLQNPKGLTKLELRRCRMIVSVARNYMKMLERYQPWTEVEQGLVDMQARFLQLHKQQLLQAKNPAERAKLEKTIKELEESLRQAEEKYGYKPFKRKPNLMRPTRKISHHDYDQKSADFNYAPGHNVS